MINFIKGIVDPQKYGGLFSDAGVNFYGYGASANAIEAFRCLLSDCISAYEQEIKFGIEFKQSLIGQQPRKTFARLQVLYQSKFCLILAAIYII